MWYPIDMFTGRIVTGTEGFHLKGGWFVIPEYRLAFDFGTLAVFQMNWSGKSLFHHTLQSHESPSFDPQGQPVHFTRLGCSAQTGSKMARASMKAGTPDQYNQRSGCDRVVMDVQDVLTMDQQWKL